METQRTLFPHGGLVIKGRYMHCSVWPGSYPDITGRPLEAASDDSSADEPPTLLDLDAGSLLICHNHISPSAGGYPVSIMVDQLGHVIT